jgi:hypothetical protein
VADLLMVAILVVFFGLAVLLVKACDRVIGPDDPSLLDPEFNPDDVAPIDAVTR